MTRCPLCSLDSAVPLDRIWLRTEALERAVLDALLVLGTNPALVRIRLYQCLPCQGRGGTGRFTTVELVLDENAKKGYLRAGR